MLLVSIEDYARRVQMQLQKRAIVQGQVSAGWFDDEVAKAKARDESIEFQRSGTTALIAVTGVLDYKYDFWTWLMDGSSYVGLAAKAKAAAEDTSVERIVFLFDCPGGAVTGCSIAADAIFAARERKECVAYIDPLCASAGYWLASQCSRIVMMPSGQVGSVGTTITYGSLDEYYKEMGIDIRVIRSAISPKKNEAHPMEPIKDSAVAELQMRCDYWADQFVGAIARGRGVSAETIKATYGQGRMLLPQEALQVGMIDAFGSLQEILAESTKRATSGATAKRQPPRKSMSSRLHYPLF